MVPQQRKGLSALFALHGQRWITGWVVVVVLVVVVVFSRPVRSLVVRCREFVCVPNHSETGPSIDPEAHKVSKTS